MGMIYETIPLVLTAMRVATLDMTVKEIFCIQLVDQVCGVILIILIGAKIAA